MVIVEGEIGKRREGVERFACLVPVGGRVTLKMKNKIE